MCDHPDVTNLDGNNVCNCCGQMLFETSMAEEWNFDRQNHRSSRCDNIKRTRSDNIDADLRKIGVDADVRSRVIELYEKVVKGHTLRSKQRRGLYAALLYHTYKEHGRTRDPISLAKELNIEISDFNKGSKRLYTCLGQSTIQDDKENTAQYFKTYLSFYTTFGLEQEAKSLQLLLDKIWSRDKFYEFKPQNLAASLVYFYMKHINRNKSRLTKVDFAKKAEITESMITRIETRLKKAVNPIIED